MLQRAANTDLVRKGAALATVLVLALVSLGACSSGGDDAAADPTVAKLTYVVNSGYYDDLNAPPNYFDLKANGVCFDKRSSRGKIDVIKGKAAEGTKPIGLNPPGQNVFTTFSSLP